MARDRLNAAPGAALRQRGMALIWALGALLFVAGIIFASVDAESASRGLGQSRFSTEGQARKLARAGRVDAYAWFRRQTIQPVPAFTPQLDLAASPAVNETDDPVLGLVREFEITPGIWGRYEVRRGTGPESFSAKAAICAAEGTGSRSSIAAGCAPTRRRSLRPKGRAASRSTAAASCSRRPRAPTTPSTDRASATYSGSILRS